MKRCAAGLAVLLLAALPASALVGEEMDEIPPWSATVKVEDHPGYRFVTAELPGVLVDSVAGEREAGVPAIWLLAAAGDDPDGPRSLYRLDPSERNDLEKIAADLPADTSTLFAVDLDGDGAREPVVGRMGGLYRPAAGREPVRLLPTPGFTPRLVRTWPRAGGDGARMHILVGGVGFLRHHVTVPGEETPVLLSEERLPVLVDRRRDGLRLATPRIVELDGGDREGPWLAVGPQELGGRRLRTILYDPSAGEGARSSEAWSRLPEPEAVRERWYLRLDGRPALVVTSLLTEKKGVLEKKKLRVFLLEADRTRAGSPPVLALRTPSRNWFATGLVAADVDGDGRDDLVAVYPEGLGGGKLYVEAYAGKAEGGFRSRPMRSILEMESKEWHFGGDVNGDGRPDLVALTDDGILVFPGVPRVSEREIVRRDPLWEIGSGDDDREVEVAVSSDGEGAPILDSGFILEVKDLAGDSRAEILVLTRRNEHRRGAVWIVLPD